MLPLPGAIDAALVVVTPEVVVVVAAAMVVVTGEVVVVPKMINGIAGGGSVPGTAGCAKPCDKHKTTNTREKIRTNPLSMLRFSKQNQ